MRIKTQRRMPAIVTKAPPEKRTIKPAFLNSGRLEFQSIGIGMVRR